MASTPHAQPTQLRVGDQMLTNGNVDHAVQVSASLIEHAPDDSDVLCFRGRCLQAQGNHAEVGGVLLRVDIGFS